MTDNGSAQGHDAFYLDATARALSWRITWENDGSAVISKGLWTLRALFDHDGSFRFARAHGPGAGEAELTLTQTVDLLERWPK